MVASYLLSQSFHVRVEHHLGGQEQVPIPHNQSTHTPHLTNLALQLCGVLRYVHEVEKHVDLLLARGPVLAKTRGKHAAMHNPLGAQRGQFVGTNVVYALLFRLGVCPFLMVSRGPRVALHEAMECCAEGQVLTTLYSARSTRKSTEFCAKAHHIMPCVCGTTPISLRVVPVKRAST